MVVNRHEKQDMKKPFRKFSFLIGLRSESISLQKVILLKDVIKRTQTAIISWEWKSPWFSRGQCSFVRQSESDFFSSNRTFPWTDQVHWKRQGKRTIGTHQFTVWPNTIHLTRLSHITVTQEFYTVWTIPWVFVF